MPALSLTERKARRRRPSAFQAWNAADNLPAEDRWTTFARHDLAWVTAQQLGLRWDSPHTGLASGFAPDTVEHARQLRRCVQDLNPNQILLVEIRYRDAPRGWLPSEHAWWKRDAAGRLGDYLSGRVWDDAICHACYPHFKSMNPIPDGESR